MTKVVRQWVGLESGVYRRNPKSQYLRMRARCYGAGTVVPAVTKASDAFLLSQPPQHEAFLLDVAPWLWELWS